MNISEPYHGENDWYTSAHYHPLFTCSSMEWRVLCSEFPFHWLRLESNFEISFRSTDRFQDQKSKFVGSAIELAETHWEVHQEDLTFETLTSVNLFNSDVDYIFRYSFLELDFLIGDAFIDLSSHAVTFSIQERPFMRPANWVGMALFPTSRDISHSHYMAVLFNCGIRKLVQLTLSMRSNSK